MRPSLVNGPNHLSLIGDVRNHVKIPRSLQGIYIRPAGTILALIGYDQRNVIHIRVHPISHQEQLDDGQAELEKQRTPVSKRLNKLFLNDGPNSL
jgi:hypothetical protein